MFNSRTHAKNCMGKKRGKKVATTPSIHKHSDDYHVNTFCIRHSFDSIDKIEFDECFRVKWENRQQKEQIEVLPFLRWNEVKILPNNYLCCNLYTVRFVCRRRKWTNGTSKRNWKWTIDGVNVIFQFVVVVNAVYQSLIITKEYNQRRIISSNVLIISALTHTQKHAPANPSKAKRFERDEWHQQQQQRENERKKKYCQMKMR